MTYKFLIPLLLSGVFAACIKDETPMPNYRQELADISTNALGVATTLTPSDAVPCTILNRVADLRPDTTYRALTLFTRSANEVWLTDFAPVLVPVPSKYTGQSVRHDALSVVAAWAEPNYVNLRLNIKGTAQGRHYFGMKIVETTTHADQKRTLRLKLIHDQNNDPLYYSRDIYLSLSLARLRQQLQARRDSVSVSIHTFKGETSYTFPL